jgi:hypothetical protein
MEPIKVIANNPWVSRRFNSVSEAAAYFGITEETVMNAIETGKSVGIGVRYWTFDEAL